jgi:uncharacterized membrane protein
MSATLTGKDKYRTYKDDADWSKSSGARETNVNESERWVSAIGGGALVAFGLTRRSWPGLLLALIGGTLVARGATGHCGMYQALGVSTSDLGRRKVNTDRAVKIEKSIIINRPAEEVYRFWRNFENFPRFMKHVESVVVKDDRHSHWVAKAPLGMKVEWDAEIISEVPNQLIGWRSEGTGDVDNAGSVRFMRAPDGGTEVRVMFQYDPPAGLVGVAMAKILGEEPEQQVQEDLARFKQVMETGQAAGGSQSVGQQSAGPQPWKAS